MAKRRGEYRGLVGKPEESDCIEDLGVDWSWQGVAWTDDYGI
jgi:hypothetical protein